MELQEDIQRRLRRCLIVITLMLVGSLATLGHLALSLKTQATAASSHAHK